MNKFKIPGEGDAEIEIARAFERPGLTYLNKPLITILEDRGVEKNAFMELQKAAIAEIQAASNTVDLAAKLFRKYYLGSSYRVPFILQCLAELGVGLADDKPKYLLQDEFIKNLVSFAKVHVLRDIKHAARIPVPESYMLVGIADEGPAYQNEGVENVFALQKGQIFGTLFHWLSIPLLTLIALACIQEPDGEPFYLSG